MVDDDPDMSALIGAWLRAAAHEVEVCDHGEGALRALERSLPDCVCLDLHLPGIDGIEVLRRIKARHPRLPVLMLTAETDVGMVVETMQAGAHDYLPKPLDRPKLLATVRNAIDHHHLTMRVAQLEREVDGRGYAGMLGASTPMRALFRSMDRVAASDITVLVHGESGTGKELVARALHTVSARSDGPFVAVNCAAIPETLEASEFFGHEKGSFTGATQRRVGRFEQAHGGTLFLDEIGELGAGLQATLLRVLQERQFQRLGGSKDVDTDFRLIAATHRDLEADVREGRFREDLYFRVVVFELEVPPLRERGDDIVHLAEHFLRDGDPPLSLDDGARRALRTHRWPGNVRELQNVLAHARVVCRGRSIGVEDLPSRVFSTRPRDLEDHVEGTSGIDRFEDEPADGTSAAPEPVDQVRTLEEIERQAIAEALARNGGNLSETGRQLGIGRTTLYRKLDRYGLRP